MSVMQGSCRVGLPIAAFCPGQTASSRQLWNGTDEDADDGAPTSAPVRFETLILMATITKAISGSGQYRNGAAAMPRATTPRRASRRGLPGNMAGQLSILALHLLFSGRPSSRTPLLRLCLVWLARRAVVADQQPQVGRLAEQGAWWRIFLLAAGLQGAGEQSRDYTEGAEATPENESHCFVESWDYMVG